MFTVNSLTFKSSMGYAYGVVKFFYLNSLKCIESEKRV